MSEQSVSKTSRGGARLSVLLGLTLLALLLAMWLALSLETTTFWTANNMANLLRQGAMIAILAIGETFVIITGGIDLSIGSVLVFSGVVADKSMAAMGTQGWGAAIVGLLVAVGCGLAWGLLNGFFIAKAKVPPLIVTLGSLGMALGLAEVITGGVDLRDIPNVMVNDIGFGNIFWQIPWLAVIAAVIVVIGIVLLHRTRFGLHTYAIGSNPEAGRRSGLNVSGQLIAIYAISGLLAGFAGWLNLAFYQSTTIAGQSTTNLSVIAGVVIGGTSLFGGNGRIWGRLVGVLFLGGVNGKLFGGLVATAVGTFSLLVWASPWRRERIFAYLDPWDDRYAQGKAYQLTHSLIAFGRGEWFGVGLGGSVEKLNYLPEAHTDFILAVIGEELGFVGVLVVILMFYWIVRRSFEIGRQALALDRTFAGLVAKGIGLWFGAQTFINMGVNLGLLPTKGLTLPLVSYGGSGILLNCIAIGLLMRVDYENRVLMRGGKV